MKVYNPVAKFGTHPLRPNRDEETVKVENLSKHRFAGKEKG